MQLRFSVDSTPALAALQEAAALAERDPDVVELIACADAFAVASLRLAPDEVRLIVRPGAALRAMLDERGAPDV